MTCSVYVIALCFGEDGFQKPSKIGVARDVRARLSNIRCANWMPVNLAAAFRLPSKRLAHDVEGIVHDVLRSRNFQGEWFAVHPTEAALVVQRAIFEAARYVDFDPSNCVAEFAP